MKKNKCCRVCGNDFFAEPILHYKNMPKSAQFLPDLAALSSEKGIDLEICECMGCRLVQLNSEPVAYYKDVIRAAAFSEDMEKFRIKQFSDFFKKYSLKGQKIIEIGCGKGEYLSIMQQCGAEAYGLEHLSESVAQCINQGLKVEQGYIDNGSYTLKQAPFAAFFILNFFEHFPDPNSALKGIYNNLAPNAIGIVEVPNFDMILRNKLFSEFIPDHIFYFTKKTLTTTLHLNGFDIIDCSEIWHDFIISATVKKGRRMDLSSFYQHQTKIKDEMDRYISQFKQKSVAVWGASHQALAIISLADLSNKIRYVVDSAPFKQGKYTSATHIPIVAPVMLNIDPVDAIIIMAASYSDEVARIVRQKFDKNINVSILRDFGLEIV
ncbi:methyltransferase [candidate division WOR-1 bacterium RIFOXYC2_FULL_37_10]|uniref:Methyltransferase n=1 Tax=candidate division WOR-1 bacterium RIFOXYB2_FULL_37_13 TaxID=1802579 RepID=A0A1F4SQ74_UNCSA|nr:MAG: methyltransferase [candidate division WOR-1 bacterium RIFOXYA2_FULL_37_7]OGC22560.1 MAG: methyltransferase [candidate division WOR-1 bacterium RIFOXYB2_FULL_37_13]OGC33375.1 MAG: methyltransferase [candidate division WOR-1 bacterium RIFOXYC2_FULL_37_10]